jgi:hypothetical protein
VVRSPRISSYFTAWRWSERRYPEPIQQILYAGVLRRNHEAPVRARAGSYDYFIPPCSVSATAPLVRLHRITEICLLPRISVSRKKTHHAERDFQFVRQTYFRSRKAMLDNVDGIDNRVGAMLAVDRCSGAVMLHVIPRPM